MPPLERLYRTKLALLATLTTVVGLAVLFVVRWIADAGPAWLRAWPLTEIGSTLFATGLIVIAFEYIDREDADARAMARLDAAITQKAPAIRDAVIQGFAFNADDLARVASPDTLDQIARNALALQLGDRPLAEDVYADIKEQIIRSEERWQNLDVSVSLSPWEGGPPSGPDAMFVVTVRREYRVTSPSSVMRFTCVSDRQDYRELLEDPSSTFAWYFPPAAGLTGASREAFELVQFTVDGQARNVRRSERAKGQVFSVTTGTSKNAEPREVTISYTFRTLARQHGHVLWLDIAKPTKGLKIELRYGDCGIAEMKTLNFIASARPTRVTESPNAVPTPSVEVAFDGWVFPKSGVGFVWVLEEEVRKQVIRSVR